MSGECLYRQGYLRKFGHIRDEKEDPLAKELGVNPRRRFELAVRGFQGFTGLPVTGK